MWTIQSVPGTVFTFLGKEVVETDLAEDLCYRWGNRKSLLGTVENGLLRPSLEPEVQKALDPQQEQATDPRGDRQ